jgi:transcriptional regulator with XRE-family HTH domain
MIRIHDPAKAGPILGDLRVMHRRRQADVAEQAGFAQSLLSKWECARNVPALDSLIRVARALGYDLALVEREDA